MSSQKNKPVVYLLPAEIIAINEVVVKKSGGLIGLREAGLLESIAIKPQASFSGQEVYPDLFLKAAVLFESIVNYHVFLDGNKRTGFAVMARFLYLNGYILNVENKEIVEICIQVATKNKDLSDIVTWIKQHV